MNEHPHKTAASCRATPPIGYIRSTAMLCVAILRKHGMLSAMNMLLEAAGLIAPVSRINGIFIGRDGKSVLNIFDTHPNDRLVAYYLSPSLTAAIAAEKLAWKHKQVILQEKIDIPVLINDLAPYKTSALLNNPLSSGIPFLAHESLARLPLFAMESFVFAVNFWADVPGAFAPGHLELLGELVGPLGREWGESLGTPGARTGDGTGSPLPDAEETPPPLPDFYVSQLENCPGLRRVCNLIRKVAPTDATVLIQGETGVGKEFVACAIHGQSPRKGKPFITVNCGAIPSGLAESELFGHERGAFTGAMNMHKGYFEQAEGGTIFLDEIGDLPPSAQVKLLRALEKGQIVRVGGSRAMSLDVRIIAATNADLQDKVRRGTFRRDLWYRLAVFPLSIPPLRERPEDIPFLVRDFLSAKSRDIRMEFRGSVSEREIRRLYAHDWPGNVRELEHVVERSLILHGNEIGPLHFALPVGGPAPAERGQPRAGARGAGPGAQEENDWPSLKEVERRYIRKVLKKSGGRLLGSGGALSVLGIHYSTLRAKMLQMGLPLPREAQKKALSGED